MWEGKDRDRRSSPIPIARWCARKDRICLLRLSEFATLKHDPEHGFLVGLLVYET